jgi:hypothetical protein
MQATPAVQFGRATVNRSASLGNHAETTTDNRLSSRIAHFVRLPPQAVKGVAWERRRTPLRPAAPGSRGVVNRRTLSAMPTSKGCGV